MRNRLPELETEEETEQRAPVMRRALDIRCCGHIGKSPPAAHAKAFHIVLDDINNAGIKKRFIEFKRFPRAGFAIGDERFHPLFLNPRLEVAV